MQPKLRANLYELDLLKNHLNVQVSKLQHWENLAIKTTYYALIVLGASALLNTLYFGIPLIPVGIVVVLSMITSYLLGVRIVRENFSYLAVVKLSKMVFSSPSLRMVGKIDALVLLVTLPFAAGGFFGYQYFRRKVDHLHELRSHLSDFERNPNGSLPHSICLELEELAARYRS
jgi:hypothetical protein